MTVITVYIKQRLYVAFENNEIEENSRLISGKSVLSVGGGLFKIKTKIIFALVNYESLLVL